jgi:hypothetical protein
MSTIEEIVKDIQSLGFRDFSPVACAKWCDNRYKEMVSRVRFKHLRKLGELVIPGVITIGTASATRGSTAVSGSLSSGGIPTTSWATDPGVGDKEHYFIRLRSGWYNVASVASDAALTLNSAFSEDTVSDVAYHFVKRTHALASDARWFGEFVLSRLSKRLTWMTEDEFEISHPGRPLASGIPRDICSCGVDSNGYSQVEIYPPPVDSEMIHYTYWSLPASLSLSTTIPQVIDSYVLREGALIDAYTSAKIAELNRGNVDAAAVYSNSAAKQKTIWEQKIKDAIRTQRGVDDVTFILTHFGGVRGGSDIRTARDHIYSNWSR